MATNASLRKSTYSTNVPKDLYFLKLIPIGFAPELRLCVVEWFHKQTSRFLYDFISIWYSQMLADSLLELTE